MSETKVNVTGASDLLLLGESAKDVPPKVIAQAFLKGICYQESDVGLYECLFTRIIHQFEPKEFEADVSCIVLPKLVVFLEKIQKELRTNALSYFFMENLTTLLQLADVLQQLIGYLVEQAEQNQLYHSLAIFPEYLLRCYTIVRQNYVTMAKETDVMEAMKSLYTVCRKMLMTFLDLLCPTDGTGTSYFRLMDNEEEYECLGKVCTLLANVVNEISSIDSQLASNVWKVILKLSTIHAEQCVTRNRASWLSQIILTLNSGIDTAFNEIRTKNEPSKQASTSLKLNAFFLRVMLKLLSLLKPHTTSELFQPIVTSLLHIKTCLRSPTVVLCGELATGIDQHLHIGYMAIVESSIPSEPFAKEFCQHQCNTSDEVHSYYTVLMHVIEQMLSYTNDSKLVATYCYRQNLLANVCTLMIRSDFLFHHHASLYRQLLTHCSVLILMGARSKNLGALRTIEETLVRMVLQEHYYTGLLGLDLWSMFVRYHSTRLLYGYFLFWKKINDQFSMFRTRPQQVFVAQLLRNLWVFLPASQKLKLIDTYPVTDKANDRLWVTVPLSGEIDEGRRKRFVQSVEKRLQNEISLLQHRPNVEGFYETLGLLLIATNTYSSTGVVVAREARHLLWNTSLDWNGIWKSPAAGTLLDCLQTSTDRIPESTLQSINCFALSDTSNFVKGIIIKLLEKVNSSVNVLSFVESLLDGRCTLISAIAYNMLRKLTDNPPSGVQQLLAKSPHIKSQLTVLLRNKLSPKTLEAGSRCNRSQLSVVHRCRASHETESCGDMTMVINRQIDELFPEVDNEDDCMGELLSKSLLTVSGYEAKKRKVEEIKKHPDSPTEPTFDRCLSELTTQGKLMKKLVQSRKLEASQRRQLQRIICSLTKALES